MHMRGAKRKKKKRGEKRGREEKKKKAVANISHPELGLVKLPVTFPLVLGNCHLCWRERPAVFAAACPFSLSKRKYK